MKSAQIKDRIANLKGRRGYEEKKALKLGFSSLHDYIADKIKKEIIEAELKTNNNLRNVTTRGRKSNQRKAKVCGCCS